MPVQSFLSELREVANSPYAWAAYVVLVTAWAIVAVNSRRLRAIKDIPAKERADVLKKEYLTKPHSGLSGEQWIRTAKHRYVFIAFLATLITIVIITGVALQRSREERVRQGTQESVPSSPKSIIPSSNSESSLPIVQHPLAVEAKPLGSMDASKSDKAHAFKEFVALRVLHLIEQGRSINPDAAVAIDEYAAWVADCKRFAEEFDAKMMTEYNKTSGFRHKFKDDSEWMAKAKNSSTLIKEKVRILNEATNRKIIILHQMATNAGLNLDERAPVVPPDE